MSIKIFYLGLTFSKQKFNFYVVNSSKAKLKPKLNRFLFLGVALHDQPTVHGVSFYDRCEYK